MSHYKDEQGRFRTKGLFFETASPTYRAKYDIPFTLKEFDYEKKGKIYISLRQMYLSYEDPTEYSFALSVLGSWDHWKRLRSQPFFREHYAAWQEELALKLQCKGVGLVAEEATSGSKSSASAAKWLAERGWIGKQDKGRPSKAKIQEEARHFNNMNGELDEILDQADAISH